MNLLNFDVRDFVLSKIYKIELCNNDLTNIIVFIFQLSPTTIIVRW